MSCKGQAMRGAYTQSLVHGKAGVKVLSHLQVISAIRGAASLGGPSRVCTRVQAGCWCMQGSAQGGRPET